MKIKPSYRTFVPEDPLHIEVYSDKGVTFAEFFIQAKDPATNATVGHWRIDDVQQEAYKCSSEGSQAGVGMTKVKMSKVMTLTFYSSHDFDF